MGNPWYPCSGDLATGWMAIRGLLDEAIWWKAMHPTRASQNSATKIDGCGELRTFWSVAFPVSNRKPLPSLPLSTPGTITFMQLVMLTSRQNDYFTRGCDHAGWNGHQLWLDLAGGPNCSANRYTILLVFQNRCTKDYHAGRSKDKVVCLDKWSLCTDRFC